MNIIESVICFFTEINSAFGVTNLTSILITLIGVLAYRFHVEINRQKYIFERFMRFSKTFNRATYLLKYGKENSYFIIHTEFPKHFSAMLNFAHVIEGESKNRFHGKWTEYENKYKEIEEHGKSISIDDKFPECFQFANDPEEIKRDRDNKEELKQLIKELFKIVKH